LSISSSASSSASSASSSSLMRPPDPSVPAAARRGAARRVAAAGAVAPPPPPGLAFWPLLGVGRDGACDDHQEGAKAFAESLGGNPFHPPVGPCLVTSRGQMATIAGPSFVSHRGEGGRDRRAWSQPSSSGGCWRGPRVGTGMPSSKMPKAQFVNRLPPPRWPSRLGC
jgi:hypothetical protein